MKMSKKDVTKTSATEKTITRAPRKAAPKKATPLKLEKIEKPKPAPVKPVGIERYFIIEFTMTWSKTGGTRGVINDSIKVGPIPTFPNKNSITEQLPTLYDIVVGKEDIEEVSVFNIRPWELPKEDFLEYSK